MNCVPRTLQLTVNQATILRTQINVDDILSGLHSIEEAIHNHDELIHALK